MSWTTREPRVYITARAKDESRRLTLRMGRPDWVLPATQVEVVRVTQTFAPINAASKRKPHTSDRTEVEVLLTLDIAGAETLLRGLLMATIDAAPYLPDGQGVDIDAVFGEAKPHVHDPAPPPAERPTPIDLTHLDAAG